MLLVLKVYETCDLTVCPARYIFFNFMYILYLNFRKISNFQAYTRQPHALSLSLHNPRLKKFESKTRSLTGALLGLVTPNCTNFRPPIYPLCIAVCYRQPTLCWISCKHYPTFCLCKPRSLYDCGSIVLVAFHLRVACSIIFTREPQQVAWQPIGQSKPCFWNENPASQPLD